MVMASTEPKIEKLAKAFGIPATALWWRLHVPLHGTMGLSYLNADHKDTSHFTLAATGPIGQETLNGYNDIPYAIADALGIPEGANDWSIHVARDDAVWADVRMLLTIYDPVREKKDVDAAFATMLEQTVFTSVPSILRIPK
jgi:hypothetical protein